MMLSKSLKNVFSRKASELPFGRLYWLVFFLGLGWMIWVAAHSPDTSFHDEIDHLNMARSAWEYPEFILNVWGRPFNTLVYMIPSLGGLTAARWFSVFLACLTVYFTTRVAEILKVKALVFVPLCLWFQPWFADMSYTANTMIPFSLLLILGIFLVLRDKLGFASLLFGLLPLTRHEGVAITGIWIIYVLWSHRNLKAALISLLPLIIYNILYVAQYGTLASGNFVDLQPTTYYGSGGWFYYLPAVIFGVYPAVLILSGFSFTTIWNSTQKRLIFAPYLVYLLTHVIIYRFGLFGSGGYGFFLVPLAPAFALSAAIGTDWLVIHQPRKRNGKRLFRIVMTVLVFAIIFTALLLTPSHPFSHETITVQEALSWLKASSYSEKPLIVLHPWFRYFANIRMVPDQVGVWPPDKVQAIPSGTVVVWDSHFSDAAGLDYDLFIDHPVIWRQIATFANNEIVVFERL